jgi:hypothetical protein
MGSTYRSRYVILHRVAVSHTESSPKISVILINFYSVNVMFYFMGPVLDMGSTYRSSHTVLHQVVGSHTKSSPKKFSQF